MNARTNPISALLAPSRIAAVVTGAGMALGAGIPVAQAAAPSVHSNASAHAAQALNALNARWNAEAAAYRASQAELAQARAIGALDARLNAQARGYRLRLSAALALKAVDARWNAEAVYFGLG